MKEGEARTIEELFSLARERRLLQTAEELAGQEKELVKAIAGIDPQLYPALIKDLVIMVDLMSVSMRRRS